MEWLVDGPPRREKRRLDANPASVPIDTHIRLAREELFKQKDEIPEMRRRAERLQREHDQLADARWLIRRKLDLVDAIRAIRDKIEWLDTDQHVQAYDEKVLPYLEAYSKKASYQVDECATKRRNISLPGETRNERISMYVESHAANHSTIVSEYLADVCLAPPRMDLHKRDVCPTCGDEMLLVSAKSIMTCPQCGYAVSYLDSTTSSLSYGDEVDFASFSYKRINHFNEWLLQVQGKEGTEIRDDVITMIMAELFRQRVVDVSAITHKKIREVLKTLKLRKTYEHVSQIVHKITSRPPMRMTSETEELCRLMFIAVQPAFERHCPADRKNFLSYSYCLYKFLQLLGCEKFLETFSLLKGRDKLMRQDQIFEKICTDLDWEFIPSV